ncbi:MAG: hypothetical protein FH749_10545 [Firmicutes bacterium]|nr:hypothetical protein [Bacillota bacterium]
MKRETFFKKTVVVLIGITVFALFLLGLIAGEKFRNTIVCLHPIPQFIGCTCFSDTLYTALFSATIMLRFAGVFLVKKAASNTIALEKICYSKISSTRNGGIDVTVYDLRQGEENSSAFYEDVSEFASRVLAQAESYRIWIELYRDWFPGKKKTDLEYALEFLSIGVYLQVYGGRAAKFLPLKSLLYFLARKRRRGGLVKIIADQGRGLLLTAFAGRGGESEGEVELDSLITWMEATGNLSWKQVISGAGSVLPPHCPCPKIRSLFKPSRILPNGLIRPA